MIDRPVPDWAEVAFEYAAVLRLAGDGTRRRRVPMPVVEIAPAIPGTGDI
jgi:hypothetical protein